MEHELSTKEAKITDLEVKVTENQKSKAIMDSLVQSLKDKVQLAQGQSERISQ